jgi:glycosyltransferase involved in cell wall biosynthesis
VDILECDAAQEGLKSVSVVIPVYRSAQILPHLVARLSATLPACAGRFELILVNDGSTDDSWSAICDLAAECPWIVGVDLMRNYGQHNALLCGIRAARYEVIVTMDDDLQHPPEEIPKLLDKLAQGYDVVYGTPQTEQHGLWRDIASQVTKLTLQSAMGMTTARQVSAFRAFRTRAREGFSRYQGPNVSVDVLLTWATTRFTSVPTQHLPRLMGESNYTFRSLVRHSLNMMTGFSIWPLRVASMIGFGFTLFGVAVLIYVIGAYLVLGHSVPGFPFLASVIAVFSGAQLFSLGIMGEYLARMHFRMMDRPAYTVRSSTPKG